MSATLYFSGKYLLKNYKLIQQFLLFATGALSVLVDPKHNWAAVAWIRHVATTMWIEKKRYCNSRFIFGWTTETNGTFFLLKKKFNFNSTKEKRNGFLWPSINHKTVHLNGSFGRKWWRNEIIEWSCVCLCCVSLGMSYERPNTDDRSKSCWWLNKNDIHTWVSAMIMPKWEMSWGFLFVFRSTLFFFSS